MRRTAARLPASNRNARHSMLRAGWVLALMLLCGGVGNPGAHAGVYTDDLSKCLVKSSDNNDRVTLVQWMFAALTLHPSVQSLASVNAEQRSTVNKKMASIFVRLLAENCRKETIDALKYEGPAALGVSFQVLGQVAGRDLMTEQHVANGMGELEADLGGDEKLKSLLKDAGVPQK